MSSSAYDVANELTGWNGTTIGYDANGNISNDGVASYTWNGRNQLISRGTTSFQYDSFGRRTLNAAGNNLLYEGWNVGQELSGTTPVANQILGGIDEFFSRTVSGGTYSPITDALGSVLALTNSSGTIKTQYGYDPFGNTTTSGATNTNEFQYTGRENDANGLYFYRARYYDPAVGRFLSEDPLGFKGSGANFYAYAADSPTNFVDPFGLTIGVIGDSQSVNQSINYLSRDPGMNQMIAEMQLSDTVYTIITTNSNTADFTDVSGDEHTIIWNPHLGLKCAHANGQEYGAVVTPALALGHELAHQRHDWEAFFLGFLPSDNYTDLEEWRVIHYYENPAARTLGEGIRSDHFGETEWVATPLTKPQCNCQGQRAGR